MCASGLSVLPRLCLGALLVVLRGAHPYTHGLVELLEALESLGISVPDELRIYGDALTPCYTLARYPGEEDGSRTTIRGRRDVFVRQGAIVEWVERVADPLACTG